MKYGQYGLAPLPNAGAFYLEAAFPSGRCRLGFTSRLSRTSLVAIVQTGSAAPLVTRPAVKKTVLGSLRHIPGREWGIAKIGAWNVFLICFLIY